MLTDLPYDRLLIDRMSHWVENGGPYTWANIYTKSRGVISDTDSLRITSSRREWWCDVWFFFEIIYFYIPISFPMLDYPISIKRVNE